MNLTLAPMTSQVLNLNFIISLLSAFVYSIVFIMFVCSRLVRDPRANYQQSLSVLEHAKKHVPSLLTKTSLMLGLGETDDQIKRVMEGITVSNQI